jgi:hypothetical protein
MAKIYSFKSGKEVVKEDKCSFCGKSKSEAGFLVANQDNTKHICKACTAKCVGIVTKEST